MGREGLKQEGWRTEIAGRGERNRTGGGSGWKRRTQKWGWEWMEKETEVGMRVGGEGNRSGDGSGWRRRKQKWGWKWVEKKTEVGMGVGGEGNRGMSEGFCGAMLSARHGMAACVVIDDTLSVPLATRP